MGELFGAILGGPLSPTIFSQDTVKPRSSRVAGTMTGRCKKKKEMKGKENRIENRGKGEQLYFLEIQLNQDRLE